MQRVRQVVDAVAAGLPPPPPPPASEAPHGGVSTDGGPEGAAAALLRAAHEYPVDSSLPSAIGHAFLVRQYPVYGAVIAAQQARLRALLERIVAAAESPATGREVAGELTAAAVRTTDAGGGGGRRDAALDAVAQFLDNLREGAEMYLDEAAGRHSAAQVMRVQERLAAAAAATARGGGGGGGGGGPALSAPAGAAAATAPGKMLPAAPAPVKRMPRASAAVSSKPQERFLDVIDNSRDTPFVPRLTEKYHALVDTTPAPDGLRTRHTTSGFTPLRYRPAAGVHPYERELAALAYPVSEAGTVAVPAPFTDLDAVRYEYVDTPAGLGALVDYLEGAGGAGGAGDGERRLPAAGGCAPVAEIAIDLEAHTLRSYQGFCCLMQLSTRARDYLVDLLALRADAHILNRLFANPAVVKVLHGCDGDAVWLQRDFGVYLVNVFDTGQAARALAYPSFGLAHLLLKFAGVTANKEFQTADWRERPLPPHLVKYAREDTHYLLGIYDRLRNELAAGSTTTVSLPLIMATSLNARGGVVLETAPAEVPVLVAAVLNASRERTLARYEKEGYSLATARRAMQRAGIARSAPVPGSFAARGGAGAAGDDDDDAGRDAAGASAAPPPTTPAERVFMALYDWRDVAAREADESPVFILNNRCLGSLATAAPTTTTTLLRLVHPLSDVMRASAADVVRTIASAVAAGAGTPAAAAAPVVVGSKAAAAVAAPASAAAPPTASSSAVSGSKRSAPVVVVVAGGSGDSDATPAPAAKRARGEGGSIVLPASLHTPSSKWVFPTPADSRRTAFVDRPASAASASGQRHARSSRGARVVGEEQVPCAVVASMADALCTGMSLDSSSVSSSNENDGGFDGVGVPAARRQQALATRRAVQGGMSLYKWTGVAEYFAADAPAAEDAPAPAAAPVPVVFAAAPALPSSLPPTPPAAPPAALVAPAAAPAAAAPTPLPEAGITSLAQRHGMSGRGGQQVKAKGGEDGRPKAVRAEDVVPYDYASAGTAAAGGAGGSSSASGAGLRQALASAAADVKLPAPRGVPTALRGKANPYVHKRARRGL